MSLTPAWFEGLWAGAATDPWGLEAGWYEQRKRAVVLAALPAPRFARGFEPGAAAGALSVGLAGRCDELVCREVVAPAAARARERLAAHPHARVEEGDVRAPWPDGPFDLVVLSELVYYFARADRDAIWRAAQDALVPGGTLVALHWLRAAPDHPVSGGEVHDELRERCAFSPLVAHEEADFRLDVLTRGPGPAPSVAERTGLR